MVGESLYSTYGRLQCSLKEEELNANTVNDDSWKRSLILVLL